MARKTASTQTGEQESQPADQDPPIAPPQEPAPGFWALEESASPDEVQKAVEQELCVKLSKLEAASNYNILVLYDDRSLDRSDANRIYRALGSMDRTRPLLLILKSHGGDIPAAYFISKLCREHTSETFEVAVPREAKSAATLICCGADRIHMGSLSELGPIDPQFGGMPALAVKHSLEHLAEIAVRHPEAQEMLSAYLAKSLPVNVIGHFERAAGSAAQYAERLLGNRRAPLPAVTNADIARRLVYEYKDHGFAIDAREATAIFGTPMVQTNSPEYEIGNVVFEALDLMEWVVARKFKRTLVFTGGLSGGCFLYKKRDDASPA